jgi:L-amino acid N-acyltransferase YncA
MTWAHRHRETNPERQCPAARGFFLEPGRLRRHFGRGYNRPMGPSHPPRIRLATESDAGAILTIYAPIVTETPISFELQPPSAMEMRRRIADTLTTLPWIVCEGEETVMGYAYGSRHRERAAYQWSVDVSVYVAADMRRRGVGRTLYDALFSILRELGYYTAFAGIALPNPASVKFHEAVGFRPVGVYRNVGFKLGKWHDVGWWGSPLRKYDQNPGAPRAMSALSPEELQRRLKAVR